MKPQQQYEAVVEQQHPATNEVANLRVVGRVFGTYDECWSQAKAITSHPVIQFKELHHGTQC